MGFVASDSLVIDFDGGIESENPLREEVGIGYKQKGDQEISSEIDGLPFVFVRDFEPSHYNSYFGSKPNGELIFAFKMSGPPALTKRQTFRAVQATSSPAPNNASLSLYDFLIISRTSDDFLGGDFGRNNHRPPQSSDVIANARLIHELNLQLYVPEFFPDG